MNFWTTLKKANSEPQTVFCEITSFTLHASCTAEVHCAFSPACCIHHWKPWDVFCQYWRPIRMETVVLRLLSSAWWAFFSGTSSSGGAWSRRDCLRSDSQWRALWGGIACNAQHAQITFSTRGQGSSAKTLALQPHSDPRKSFPYANMNHSPVLRVDYMDKQSIQHLSPWQADVMWMSTHLNRKKAT